MAQLSGLKKVEHSPDGAVWTDLGTPLSENATYTPEPAEVETGKGTMLYGGTRKTFMCNIPDMTKYAALETIMKANTEQQVRVTFMDDTQEVLLTEATVKVKKNYTFAVASINSFEFKAAGFAV